jgi:hypothetical protein
MVLLDVLNAVPVFITRLLIPSVGYATLESIVQPSPALHAYFALLVKHLILAARQEILAKCVPRVQLQLQVTRRALYVPQESLPRMSLIMTTMTTKLTRQYVPIVLLELILLQGKVIASHVLMV